MKSLYTSSWHSCIKGLLVKIAYVFVVLVSLAGCQGCHRGAVAPSPQLGGIPNLGNTCYMNAVLQIIAKLYPDIFDGRTDDLARAGQVIVDTIREDQGDITREEAEAFYTALLKTPRVIFQRGRQEDADECFTILLQNSTLCPYSTWQRIISRKGIIRNYGPWLEENNHNLGFLRVPLPDNDNVTMQECLEYMFRYEELTGENQYRDERLGKDPVDATRCDRLEINSNSNAPLAIQLRRFINDQSKNRKAVTDTFYLTVPAGIQYNLDNNASDLYYHLQGFIVHSGGNTIHSGHYLAYINRSGQWRLYDDAEVHVVTPEQAEKAAEQAYLYFYRQTS